MFCTVPPPCPLHLPQSLLWPRRPGSDHGSHAGGGGSRRSDGGGTGAGRLAVVLLLLLAADGRGAALHLAAVAA